jgi:hypothetical protein
MSSKYHLAQLNVAVPKASLTSPLMADFVNNLERINALAEDAPGFVWRLQDDAGSATAIRPFDESTLVNMSVWRDLDTLKQYAYASTHVDFLRRRHEWFERPSDVAVVLWWIPAGHRPDVDEAVQKLQHLRTNGPTADAFTMARPFPAPDTTSSNEGDSATP